MAIDPTAARPASTPSDNPTYQGAWVCYINGRAVPIYAFDTTSRVWEPPTARIHLLPDVLLMRLGHEDRVPVAFFYLDHWVDPAKPDFRLLFDGEILGWSYSHAKGTRTVSFTVTAHIHIFQQLYFQYMTNIDDVVAARSPELVASSIATTPGPIYPYALYHQGLNQTAAQIEAATPRPGVTVTDVNLDAETPGATLPIQAPYELVYNAVKGCIDATIPNERRSLPMMNFFARHIRKTQFHNRWVRLPIMEDPAVLAGELGVFPIFRAARSVEALNAMQRHVASQVGNAGPVWNVFQQTLGLVYMEIGMVPNPCSVLVQLNDTSGVGNPVDGRIIGHPRYDTPLRDQRTVDAQQGPAPQAPETFRRDPPSPLRRSEEEPLFVPEEPTQRIAVVDNSERVVSTAPVGSGVRFNRVGAGGTEFGVDPLTPIRLAQYFVKPAMHFAEPPACNVIFPSMVDSWTYDENYLAQPTRIYVNDSVMTGLLRADGANREFMLHALTVAYPEEADALLHHKVNAAVGGAGSTAPTESGKNLLLWPEEYYKGPVTAKSALPAWFQFARQFSNAQAATLGAAGSGGPAVGVPPSGLARAESLMGGPAGSVSGGLAFSVARRNSQGQSYFHAGSDISAAIGTPVYAVLPGQVSEVVANFQPSGDKCGNMVVVNHPRSGPNGETVTCIYMHFQRFGEGISEGRRVNPGDVLGYVGVTNGSAPDRDAVIRAFNIPPAKALEAFNAGTQAGAERVLAPFLENRPIPSGTDLSRKPWSYTEREANPDQAARARVPHTPVPQWKILARCVAGLFHQTGGAHCHLEVIFTPPGQRIDRSPPRYVNNVLTPNNRVDAVAWLASIGVALGTNHSRAPGPSRRGRIPPATGAPAPTPDINTANLTASAPASAAPLPSAGVSPQITTVARNIPRIAPNAGAATPGAGGPGAPHTTAHEAPTTTALAPGGTAAEGDSFASLFRLYAQQEYLRQRYAQRGAGVNMRFNPYILAGFPGMVFDNLSVGMHAVGHVQSVQHSGIVRDKGARMASQAQLSYCRTIYEFIADVRADAVRFGGRVTSAPAELISEIREVVQDEGRAEQFYKKLLYGGRENLAGACFRWTEAMGYSDGGQVIPIEIVGESVAVQEERLRAAEAAGRGEGTASGSEQGQPSPATAAQSASAGGVSSQGQTTVHTNLDPNKELSPRQNIYSDAFRSYDVAMRLAARPACTLDEYIRFWHGGKTVGQMQATGQVGPIRTDYAYRTQLIPEVVAEAATPTSVLRLVYGVTERPTAQFYDWIFKLVPGPGRNTQKDRDDAADDAREGNSNRPRRAQTEEDRLRPPTDEEQGFTRPPAQILPTARSQGVPETYPDTRADWDTVLDLYREKVVQRVSPSR